ncbi:hypothetical protein [Streptomyces klenkii]|uniref:hypothetical protein n=1 Tax=Streptomyces klenkii TaxID=1420899 RepID=UPI00342E09CE
MNLIVDARAHAHLLSDRRAARQELIPALEGLARYAEHAAAAIGDRGFLENVLIADVAQLEQAVIAMRRLQAHALIDARVKEALAKPEAQHLMDGGVTQSIATRRATILAAREVAAGLARDGDENALLPGAYIAALDGITQALAAHAREEQAARADQA